MYQALYRKYRPDKFDDVVGQKVIVKTLSNAIKNNKISHAYLFCGPRGTGKTSIAKIFAKTVNCENLNDLTPCDSCNSCKQINNKQTIDIIEIDAASNNGVDEIRELKNNVNLVPANGKYKVYIIDEVHMLTTSAFNALLKTLEEPPKHAIFILATTEAHKVPQTVLSRCQKFDFKKIANNDIFDRLKNICEIENIKIDDAAIKAIAVVSNGGMRDSLSLLDQLSSYCDDAITVDIVNEINGNISYEQMYSITRQIFENNTSDVLNAIEIYDSEGKNLAVIINSLIEYIKNLLIFINDSSYFKDEELIQKYDALATIISENKIYDIIDILLKTLKDMKYENNKLLLTQLSFIKISNKIKQNDNIEINKTPSQNYFPGNNLTTREIKNNDELDNNKIKEEVKFENNQISLDILQKIDQIKKIRINNTLAQFNKKDMMEFKNKIDDIKILLMDPDYSSIISLVVDGEIKAKGNNNILFVYKNNSLEQLFNSELIKIEKAFNKIYNNEYKLIATNEQEWNIIKKEFNQAMKNKQNIYEYQEETFDITKLLAKNKEYKQEEIKTDIDNMFEEIVQYN